MSATKSGNGIGWAVNGEVKQVSQTSDAQQHVNGTIAVLGGCITRLLNEGDLRSYERLINTVTSLFEQSTRYLQDIDEQRLEENKE